MDAAALRLCLIRARNETRWGNVIAADVHMRHALGIANALKDSRLRACCFRIRNKLRPHVARRYAEFVTELSTF
jgi:hypothetical protein